MESEKCLDIADKVLKEHFRPDMYSFDGNADCAVCLVKNESEWDVYYKEHSAVSDRVPHSYLIDAIIDMIDRLGGKEAASIRHEFMQAWDPDFVKLTPQERASLRKSDMEMKNGDFVSENDMWGLAKTAKMEIRQMGYTSIRCPKCGGAPKLTMTPEGERTIVSCECGYVRDGEINFSPFY